MSNATAAAEVGTNEGSSGTGNSFQLPVGVAVKSARKPPSRKSKFNDGASTGNCSSQAGSTNSILLHIDNIVKEGGGGDPIPEYSSFRI